LFTAPQTKLFPVAADDTSEVLVMLPGAGADVEIASLELPPCGLLSETSTVAAAPAAREVVKEIEALAGVEIPGMATKPTPEKFCVLVLLPFA
jgi:hypothetical protein